MVAVREAISFPVCPFKRHQGPLYLVLTTVCAFEVTITVMTTGSQV